MQLEGFVEVSAILRSGVYALVRVFTLLFTQDTGYTHALILVIAGFTMVTGVLGAVAQTEFRKLLSFHIISQIGYLLMGLGLFSISNEEGHAKRAKRRQAENVHFL